MNYYIVRFFKDHPEGITREVIVKGLTLEQAQAHCKDPESSSSTATNDIARARTAKFGQWFDGYDSEESADGQALRAEEEADDDPEEPEDGWMNREGMPEFNGSFR